MALLSGLACERNIDREFLHMLDGPLRLEVETPEVFQEFLLGLRVYHYRPQPRGSSEFREIHFDTEDGNLGRLGLCYALRVELEGKGKHSLRLEELGKGREPGTWTSKLPRKVGEAILAGEWNRAWDSDGDREAPRRLRERLLALDIDFRSLVPRVDASLHQTRYGVSDKGRTWFELTHERWKFRPHGQATDADAVNLEYLVLELASEAGGPELERRVRTLEEFSRTMFPLRKTRASPMEQALSALGLE